MIKMIVFLGNPGKEYEKTRHNAGFILSDKLFPSVSWQGKFHSLFAIKDGVKLIKPLTYMNLSGTAVSECASFYKISPEDILIVHDDLELPLGKARVQKGGGLQGHNGLRSIKERLGSDSFRRLRIGIGRPPHGDVRVYVTSPFKENELITLKQVFSKIDEKVCFLSEEWEISLL